MSLHYSYRPAQSSSLPAQQPSSQLQTSAVSSSQNVSSGLNNIQSSLISSSSQAFQNNNNNHQIVPGPSSSTVSNNVPCSNLLMNRSTSNASSNSLFVNNNDNLTMNSHPTEIKLNAHNYQVKHGRPICINVNGGNINLERKLKVYENNHKLEDPEPIEMLITLENVFDSGAFGHVRKARIKPDNRLVAVKQVLQDNRYRNRELPLMKQLRHCNIVTLLYYYYHMEEKEKKNLYLNLVMEYIPSNLNMLIQKFGKNKKSSRHSSLHVTPLLTIKLCMYQIFRALAYIHSIGICHRDIKPNNLLFNQETGVLKICDFGSAKNLNKGESNVSYICARFYRAPELLFGATDYNEKIDLWSTGVVFSELLLGEPIFHEHSGIDQLVLIISKLGTPTKEQIKAMNQKYAKYDFPQVNNQSWESLFPCAPTDALDLISKLFQYDPSHRIQPLHACAHQFFDELREPNKKWFNRDLPPLFDFTQHELSIDPNINSRLLQYKTKPNTVSNIAFIQPQQLQQQQQMICNVTRIIPQRNHLIPQPSQSHHITYPNPAAVAATNAYPNPNNFSQFRLQQMGMVGGHCQTSMNIVNNHQSSMGDIPQFTQNYTIGSVGGGPQQSTNNNNNNNNPTGPSIRTKQDEYDDLVSYD